jgi:hypothetical protein
MYSADNDGKLAANMPGGEVAKIWVPGNMTIPKEATNANLLRQGKLFPYASHASLYRCPSDTSRSLGCPRVRSYSMNSWMGSRYMEDYPRMYPYRTFVRDGELAIAGPSRLWVFLDEHEASLDDAWFLVTMDDSRPFESYPASRHEWGYGLNYADGHVATAKLRDPGSRVLGTENVQIARENADWIWLKQATTIR